MTLLARKDAPVPEEASSAALSPVLIPKLVVQLLSNTLVRTFRGKHVPSLEILTTTPLIIRFFTFKEPAHMFCLRSVMLLCLSIYNVAMVFHLFIDSIRLGILYWYILIFCHYIGLWKWFTILSH